VVLLFDDLYRSGETLAEATRTLQEQGRVQRVYVLTVTRTRVLR
jgi:competence protein ComFC